MPAAPKPPGSPPSLPARGVNRRFAAGRAIMALMLREMATRYGRSPGGYLWAILEPLGVILIFSIGFSLIIRNPPLGSSFPLFFATAFLPFMHYQNISGTVARSINFSHALLFYPAVTWVDAVLARFILNALTDILVMLMIFTGFFVISTHSPVLEIGAVLKAILMATFLGLGVGMLNCVLIGLFQVWEQIWSIVTRPLFLVSGVFFLYEDMPDIAQGILWYNPLLHITGLMRQGFYPTYNPTYISIPFVIIVTLLCLFLGVVLMGRYHRQILNNG